MDPSTLGFVIVGAACTLASLWLRLREHIPGLWQNSSRFNSTEDWIGAPEYGPTPESIPRTGPERELRILGRYLESGETLVGFARGYFSPGRRQDWGRWDRTGIQKYPLLIAATPRRLLLLEITPGQDVLRFCSIRHDAIRFLCPPRRGMWGTSGRMRLGLHSGLEYQLGFLGPLCNEALMQQEQRLAVHLRGLAQRFPTSAGPRELAA
jgi:hypothetical protein